MLLRELYFCSCSFPGSRVYCEQMLGANVPVAQLDKASDYESEDWGFKSLPGYGAALL